MVSAIIVAAGQGRRMGVQTKKQFLMLEGKEILARTVEQFEQFSAVEEIILVTGEEDLEDVTHMAKAYGWQKIAAVVQGGRERQDSVSYGLKAVSAQGEIILVHDGVRPFVTEDMVNRAIDCARKFGGCALGVPAKDTVKICDAEGVVLETPNRNALWYIQTPQVFRRDIIEKAYKMAAQEGFLGTDDASVVEFYGAKVKIIQGSYQNIKITTKEDLLFGASFLKEGKECGQ